MFSNMLSKNYSLEKHLKLLSDEDQDYELLYSIWDLNKKNLMQGLNLVSSTFPHYSGHDISHSMTIINNIQCFLGEERIRNLGATDTFLILMAGLTHDIGMILTYKIVEEEWQKDNFQNILNSLSSSDDNVIADAARLLLLFNKNENKGDIDGFKWALEIKNAVVIITAEIFRNKHAKQGAEDLTSNEEFKKLAENFHSDQLPNRFMDLLANVAFLHGESFDQVMTCLYPKANGYKGDYIHPRFIACMIRLGDLLDFDSNRFNAYSIATIKEMPKTSLLHQQKHTSVKHMLISPNTIEAELDCLDEKVYRISRSWFDWLENEVNNQSREWTNIAPADLGGLPPIISKDCIRILYNGIQANPELLNLRFSMSQKKIFSILQGGGIYKEPGFAFIREIVQNAFDASKLQMWNDMKAGFYDSYFKDSGVDISEIKFPDDITPSIYKQYPVTLQVKWKDKERKILCFECSDNGTGISESALLRMTKFVGESYNKDSRYVDSYNKMPYWLRPTAAFGIGLQSIFFVSPIFEVETSHPGETTKRIVFRSAADNQYSSIVEENIKRKRGTTVRVDIHQEKFTEFFGSSFSWSILGKVDVFKGEGDDLYLAKIDDFVRTTFGGIENFEFCYETENSDRSFRRCKNNNNSEQKYKDPDYKCSCSCDSDFLVFEIYEKKFGSTFKVWFNNDIKNLNLPQKLFLRDVLVANAKLYYWKTEYLGFEWNLNSQTTDKVVDLSRDNLTYKGKQQITDALLNNLLPDSLKFINTLFIEKLTENNNESSTLPIQYLNYCLTSLACRVNTYDLSYLEKIKIPFDIASYDGTDVTADKIFKAESLFLIEGVITNGDNVNLPKIKERIINENEDLFSGKLIVWGSGYLQSALMFNYICTEVVKYENGFQMYKLEKNDTETIQPKLVVCRVDNYLNALEKDSFHECSRSSIFGLDKYSKIVVKINYISGFERFPDYSTCSIYTPFSKKDQVDELLSEIKDLDDHKIKEYIRSNLSKYITPYMMRVVKSYNVNDNVTEEEIKDEYISLIYDFIKLKEKTFKKNDVD